MIQGRDAAAGILGVICAIAILGLISFSQGGVFGTNLAARGSSFNTVSSTTVAAFSAYSAPAASVTTGTEAQNNAQSISSFSYTQTETMYSSTTAPTVGTPNVPASFQGLNLGSNSSQMIQSPTALFMAALLGGISIVLAFGVFFVTSRRIK